jgi:hypothetical protein
MYSYFPSTNHLVLHNVVVFLIVVASRSQVFIAVVPHALVHRRFRQVVVSIPCSRRMSKDCVATKFSSCVSRRGHAADCKSSLSSPAADVNHYVPGRLIRRIFWVAGHVARSLGRLVLPDNFVVGYNSFYRSGDHILSLSLLSLLVEFAFQPPLPDSESS